MNFKESKPFPQSIAKIVISIIVVAIGWLFAISSATSARVDKYNNDMTTKIDKMNSQYINIQTSLASIQTDLSWLKNNYKR